MKHDILHRVLQQVQLPSHGSPDVDHVASGYSDCAGVRKSPSICIFAKPAVRLRLHTGELIAEIVLIFQTCALNQVAPRGVMNFVAREYVRVKFANNIDHAIDEIKFVLFILNFDVDLSRNV